MYIRNIIIASILVIQFILFDAAASPIVVKDNRIENLNGYPSVGRGYTLHSNRLLSMCFKSIEKTKPSFDLNYELKEVNDEFFREIHILDKDKISRFNLYQFIKQYQKNSEKEAGKTYKLKNLVVKVEIKSYYYSLNETKSDLSKSVKKLLESKHYVTFFNSCGHYYVRAVGSFSTYMALIQYRLLNDKDEEFAKTLEKGLFNFQAEEKENVHIKKIKNSAGFRGLRVYVKGVGLSKMSTKGNEMANLIPLDIVQFRRTIQDAVKLMQNPDTGIVSNMEVVPWLENPKFAAYLINESDSGKKVSADKEYTMKQRMIENSGVITEINHISQSQLEKYHIANMCLKRLFKDYVDKEGMELYQSLLGAGGSDVSIIIRKEKKLTTLTDIIDVDWKLRKFDLDRTYFYNQYNESDESLYITLKDFIKYFAKNSPRGIFKLNEKYLKGRTVSFKIKERVKDKIRERTITRKIPGALRCIKELLRKGLENVDYREIRVNNARICVDALKPIKLDTNFIDQYCLPKPATLQYKETGEGKKIKKAKTDDKMDDPADTKTGKDGKVKTLEDINTKKNKGSDSDKKDKVPGKKKDKDKDKDKVKTLNDINND